MLIRAPNVLLLDEPTNDLDIQTLSVLEDFLEDFRGCVIVVSHDRYFLDRTVDRLFCFENGRLRRFEGNYSEFLEHQRQSARSQQAAAGARQEANKTTAKPQVKAAPAPARKRRSFKESRELEQLDRQLPDYETRKQELERAMEQNGADLASISLELAELIATIEAAEERWLELSELAP